MANRKTNFLKNVVITNLPALAALLLMAVALRITLQFNVILSFLVLLIVYFFLGVTVELILDKIHARKKKNELFKKYTNGTFTDEKTETTSVSLEELLRSASSGEQRNVQEDEPIIEKPLIAPDEVNRPAEDVVRETIYEELESEVGKAERQEAVSTVPVEPISEADEDLLNSLTTGGFDLEPDREEFSDSDEEEHTPEAESVPFQAPEEVVSEEASPKDFIPVEKEEKEDDFLSMTISDLDETAPEAPSGDIDVLFKDLFAGDIKENADADAISGAETSEQEMDHPDTHVSQAVPEKEIRFDAETVKDALREVNEDIQLVRSQAEKEKADNGAPKSIFENDGFDVDFEPAGKTETKKSILFESVPDTEDDLEFMPYEDSLVPPMQKGKVRVDPRKIDELYTITRDRKEGSIFGRKKKK